MPHRKLLHRVSKLSRRQLCDAIYRDELTGVLNRRAFEHSEAERTNAAVAVVDLDSLKYVNDFHGYRAGDRHLFLLSALLVYTFGADNVFRLGGDEFAVVDQTSASRLHTKLLTMRKRLPGFSFGVAFSLDRADAKLREDKKAREACGRRAVRGAQPPWIHTTGELFNEHN